MHLSWVLLVFKCRRALDAYTFYKMNRHGWGSFPLIVKSANAVMWAVHHLMAHPIFPYLLLLNLSFYNRMSRWYKFGRNLGLRQRITPTKWKLDSVLNLLLTWMQRYCQQKKASICLSGLFRGLGWNIHKAVFWARNLKLTNGKLISDFEKWSMKPVFRRGVS